MDLESLPKPEGTIPRNAGVLQPFVPYVLLFLFFFAISASYAASLSEKESHRKMVALLEEIRAQDLDDNPYQGEGRLRQLEDQLQALPDAAPAQDKISLHFSLGIAELFLGRERRALDHLAAAEGMLAAQRSVPSHVVNEIHFRLGLAWLRLGETQNCVLNPNADHCILPIRPGGFHTLPEGSRQAIPYFQAVLDNTAAEERLRLSARWLLNIAYMTLGQYPERVPPAHRIPPKAFESQAAFPRWVNVAPALGLDTFSLSGGAVADDFDGDGYLDFFVSTSDLTGQLRFFRNGGDGTFADRTTTQPKPPPGATTTSMAISTFTSATKPPRPSSPPANSFKTKATAPSPMWPPPPVLTNTPTPKPSFGATTTGTAGRIYMCPISDSPTGSTTIKASSPLGPASQPGFGTSTTTATSTCSSLHTRPPSPTSPPRIGATRCPWSRRGWLAVEVVGVESNRSGIGTQLRVDVVEGGQRRSLYRWVGSGGSFGGNPLRQYVGLGSAERVAQLVVFWPQSDREQVFDEVPVNAIIRVTEGRDQLEILALPAFKFDVEHPKRAEHHLHK